MTEALKLCLRNGSQFSIYKHTPLMIRYFILLIFGSFFTYFYHALYKYLKWEEKKKEKKNLFRFMTASTSDQVKPGWYWHTYKSKVMRTKYQEFLWRSIISSFFFAFFVAVSFSFVGRILPSIVMYWKSFCEQWMQMQSYSLDFCIQYPLHTLYFIDKFEIILHFYQFELHIKVNMIIFHHNIQNLQWMNEYIVRLLVVRNSKDSFVFDFLLFSWLMVKGTYGIIMKY